MRSRVNAWPFFHSVRLGHGLNDVEALGYAPGTDLSFEAPHLLFFDYQGARLDIAIAEIDVNITHVVDTVTINDFGSDDSIVTVSGPSNHECSAADQRLRMRRFKFSSKS